MSRSESLCGILRAAVLAALILPAVPARGLDVVWVYPVCNSLVTESPVPLVEVRSSAGRAPAKA